MIRSLFSLCEEISMPPAVTEQIISFGKTLNIPQLQPQLELLFNPDTWEEGLSRLQEHLGEDPMGLKMLTCQLICALNTRKRYQEKSIPDDIFLATMDCFPRFVKEHMESFGTFGFDREWWTVRQLSGVLFRIGLLEYELREGFVSLHIPSGATLEPGKVSASLEAGRAFLVRHFPDWADKPFTCHSWLLSPTLRMLLPKESNIVCFQNRFSVTPTGAEDDDYLQWAFKRKDLPTQQLPEDTSLQRKLKAHLLNGGSFADARGTLLDSSC